MAGLHLRAVAIAFFMVTVSACASAPPSTDGNYRPTDASKLFTVDFDGESAGQTGSKSLVTGDLGVDLGADRLRYKATYSLVRGDILSTLVADDASSPPTPSTFGGQQIGSELELRLPDFAGAPLSIDYSSHMSDSWQTSGYSQAHSRYANLSWSPGPVAVVVHWSGSSLPFGGGTALNCDLRTSIEVPTYKGSGHSESLGIHGARCRIAADGTPYADATTSTFGLDYAWDRPNLHSEAQLSVIDPGWVQGDPFRTLEPGYSLGLTQQREVGPLTATATVTLRHTSSRETAAADHAEVLEADSGVATDTSLTWKLPLASLSAHWASGADPLWFAPEPSAESDRFGFALNLSSWVETFMPSSSPKFAVNWDWSRVRRPDDNVVGDNSIMVDVSLLF